MDEKILKLLNNKEEYYPTQLTEKYPHILDKIMMMWDSPEFDSCLNKFMLDKREHPRHGFPPEVASELLRLSMLHSSIYGMHSSKLWIEPSNIRID